VLLPAGTIYRGTAKHYSSGEVQSAYESILARWRENSNTAVLSPSADGPAFIPIGKPRGLQPGDLAKTHFRHQSANYRPGEGFVRVTLADEEAERVAR
jgi:hypothetical protein